MRCGRPNEMWMSMICCVKRSFPSSVRWLKIVLRKEWEYRAVPDIRRETPWNAIYWSGAETTNEGAGCLGGPGPTR